MTPNEKALVIAAVGYIAVLAGEYASVSSVGLSLQFVGAGMVGLMFVYVVREGGHPIH